MVLICAAPAPAVISETSTNPLPVSGIGDPFVLKTDSGYYLYATSGFFLSLQSDMGIRVWHSFNLVDWKAYGWAYIKSEDSWGQSRLWAPEVIQGEDGKYYMFSTASAAGDSKTSIIVLRADTPLGPFTEYVTPLVTGHGIYNVFDNDIFKDTNGHYYLYWASDQPGHSDVCAQEITSDFQTLIGTPANFVVTYPYPTWEGNVCEAPFMFKDSGIYYLMYSGNVWYTENYGVGYATSTNPLGPFTTYAGNPILKKDMAQGGRIAGPGSHGIITAPDGSLKIVYNALTNPDTGGSDRTLYIDDFSTAPGGVLAVNGPTRRPESNTELEEGIAPDWQSTGFNVEGWAWPSFDEERHQLRVNVAADNSRYRLAGLATNRPAWLPYSAVGPESYVRAKFYLYTGGETDPGNLREIPNVRLRVCNRFAVSAMLDIMHHQLVDPGNDPVASELRPSTDPEHPSLYRVDYDPIDVPFLETSTSDEGIWRGFEALCFEPQENGYIALAESEIQTYPASLLPDSDDPSILKQVYAPTATDAGSLKLHSDVEISNVNLINPTYPGDFAQDDRTSSVKAALTEGPFGVTIDSSNVSQYNVAFMLREFYPGPDLTKRLRVQEGKQYKVRFHMTSTQQSNRNSWIFLRTRSAKWAWTSELLLTGAYTTNGSTNQMITFEAAPGIGCLNPDKIADENGGWYTVLTHTPLSKDIRPEFAPEVPVEDRMPLLAAQPGPGENAMSNRDFRVGLGLMDSPGIGEFQYLEKGNFTIDRIEVREYNLIPD
jgi:hypothetical protein